MVARQLFICSAIEKCRETVNCCPHKIPHIKDERCVPRECRYAPGAENIDCDPFDPAHPRAPVKAPVAPVKTVEQEMKEPKTATEAHIEQEKAALLIKEEENKSVIQDEDGQIETRPIEPTKEQDIKEAVKKASQKSAKAPKKIQGRKNGE
jgi:hypothetical protein